MSVIEYVEAREILDSRGNPTVEVDVVLEDGSERTRSRAVRGVDRRTRGGRASRRRQEALSRQGRPQGRRERQQHHCAEVVGLDALDQVDIDQHHDRARRNARTRASSGPTRSSASPWPCARAAADVLGLPLYRTSAAFQRLHAAGADDEHPQRRQARGQHRRLPGVHGHAGRGRELPRGAADGGGDLPQPEDRPQGQEATTRASATKAGSRPTSRATKKRSR